MVEKKIGVLFVCLGNICRSPMAEAVFRQMVTEKGLADRFEIDSAGTGNWHIGKPPHHGTREILDRYGISYEGMKGRQVSSEDFSRFDYIVAMDSSNESDLRELAGIQNVNIVKLLDLVNEINVSDVPDPYFTGNFDETYELVTAGCSKLLAHIWKEKN